MPRTFECFRAEMPVIIDGVLEDKAWERAPVISDFVTWDSRGNLKPAVSRTEVRMLWDDRAIYFGARMEDKDLYAIKTARNSNTWEDDVFEVFLKPRRDLTHYYEFHVTPRNVNLELFIPRRKFGTIERFYYSSGMTSAVTLQGTLNDWHDVDQGWTAEMAIPFTAFRETTTRPKPGDEWLVGLCRFDYSYHLPPELPDGVECSSAAHIRVKNFHHYEDYDILVFKD